MDLNHSKVQPHIHLHVFEVKNCRKKTAYEKKIHHFASFLVIISKKKHNTVLLQQNRKKNTIAYLIFQPSLKHQIIKFTIQPILLQRISLQPTFFKCFLDSFLFNIFIIDKSPQKFQSFKWIKKKKKLHEMRWNLTQTTALLVFELFILCVSFYAIWKKTRKHKIYEKKRDSYITFGARRNTLRQH